MEVSSRVLPFRPSPRVVAAISSQGVFWGLLGILPSFGIMYVYGRVTFVLFVFFRERD